MFERFTQSAREVVVGAQEQANDLQHHQIQAEHLLLAVLRHDGSASAQVLRAHGVQAARLVQELAALGAADHDALREIGIDLTAVRQRAEAAFGPGALDRPTPRRRGLLWRRTSPSARLRFSAAAKRGLEQSLRQSLALRHSRITVDHILLGLLADDQDSTARTLGRLGVSAQTVRDDVRTHLVQAA